MALGGQGAPLAPGFHDIALRHPLRSRVVLNCGGIANISVLVPGQPCLGYDTGPANMLLDAWAQQHLGRDFDADGAWAAQGRVHAPLLTALLADPYFAAPPPKSTGREHFGLAWLQRALAAPGMGVAPVDVQRTLLELSAASVAQAVALHAASGDLLVCGGGARNAFFMQRLAALHPQWQVSPTDAFGVPAQWMEAMAFASFAQSTLAGVAANAPAVTGASRPCVLGGIYPP
jgi:anhydro-N-acetylmuramic acid kinase